MHELQGGTWFDMAVRQEGCMWKGRSSTERVVAEGTQQHGACGGRQRSTYRDMPKDLCSSESVIGAVGASGDVVAGAFVTRDHVVAGALVT